MSNTSATGGYLAPVAPGMSDDELDAQFQQLIVGVSGLPGSLVRPRWQEPAPKQPPADVTWCAVGITEEVPDANAYLEHDPTGGPEGLGQHELQRHETLSVLATFYGPHAKQYAKIVRDGLAISQNREALQTSYISFQNTDTIRSVPENVGGQWVKRYDLPLYFRRLVKRAYAIQTIASADVEINNDSYQTIVKVNP